MPNTVYNPGLGWILIVDESKDCVGEGGRADPRDGDGGGADILKKTCAAGKNRAGVGGQNNRHERIVERRSAQTADPILRFREGDWACARRSAPQGYQNSSLSPGHCFLREHF